MALLKQNHFNKAKEFCLFQLTSPALMSHLSSAYCLLNVDTSL